MAVKVSNLKLGRPYKSKITDVYIFKNGIVVGLDEKGRQMPRFSGKYDHVVPHIIKRLERQKGKITVHMSINEQLNISILDTEEWGNTQKFFRELKQ